ncbi:DUF6211 family protein [Streptomyces chrestomyceticus]|uniref:DUF6211 family protein n=1 Tax=Streptomyces chrestomyceticus TaxID=68185 RepID=UPI0033C32B41
MVDELRPLPDSPAPRPGDTVRLHPGTLAAGPGPYTVADVDMGLGGLLELNLATDHPGYWDWAHYVEAADVRTVTRYDADGPRTWTLTAP